MKNKLKYIVLLVLFVSFTTGCSLFKRDTMENINIVTTIYSSEYVINYLYGNNAIVNSIYPDDTNVDTYTFTEKQIKDNSKKNMFIYLGKTKDSNIAINYLNKNKKLKLIDATFGMEYKNGEEELWINPSNLLMMAQNIKEGLCEYISNTYLIKEIEENYNNLKIELSELDAEVRLSYENAKSNVIFTNSPALKYLEKYGLEIIIIKENDSLYDKNLTLLNNYIKNSKIKNFYILENTEISKDIQQLIDNKKINSITLRNLKNITDNERNNKVNYIEISKENLNLLKTELY